MIGFRGTGLFEGLTGPRTLSRLLVSSSLSTNTLSEDQRLWSLPTSRPTVGKRRRRTGEKRTESRPDDRSHHPTPSYTRRTLRRTLGPHCVARTIGVSSVVTTRGPYAHPHHKSSGADPDPVRCPGLGRHLSWSVLLNSRRSHG